MQARRGFDVFAFARGALASLLFALTFAPAAAGAIGDPLGSFVPSPGGNGRGVAVADGSTTAYYTTVGAEDIVYRVDLRTQASLGALDTDLELVAPGTYGFGALDFDPQGKLWGAEYKETQGWIDRIDPGTGAVERRFNAAEQLDSELTGVDGLAVDADGTLWISGEGLGAEQTTVFHVTPEGEELSRFTVPFGNSGLEVDAEGLWLAEIDSQTIHRYDKLGDATGLEFSVAPVEPEDLALDRCTFPGRLALWAHGAALGAGPLAAYDVGVADSTGCPVEDPGPSEPGGGQGNGSGSGGGTAQPGSGGAGIGTGGGSAPVAGKQTWLVVRDPRDPRGTLFTYVWHFGDGSRARGGARIAHRYPCAGIYRVRVTIIDSAGVRRRMRGRVVVAFPRSAFKRHRGLSFSPRVSLLGRRAIVSLRWAGRSRAVRPRAVRWRVDRRRFRPAGPRRRVKARVARGRNHRLVAKVRFSDGRQRMISTCFYH